MPYGQSGYGYGPQSGGNYGLAYGIGEALAGVPAAVMHGEDIKRKRDAEDFDMAAKKNAYDRQMTEQQISDYAPQDAPPQVEEQNLTGYNMAGDDTGTVYSAADVAEGRAQLAPYADSQGNLSPELGMGQNLHEVFKPKIETSKRDMDPYEKAAWTAQKKADFAASKGRGDLSLHYLGQATQQNLQGRYVKVQNAIGLVQNGNFDQAVKAINQIGEMGHIDNITQNDDGSYDFHTPQGVHTFTSEGLDKIVQHAQQMTLDPKVAAQYMTQIQLKNQGGKERAEIRETGVEKTVAGRSKDVAAKIAGTGSDVKTKVQGALDVQKLRNAGKVGTGGSGSGKVTPSTIKMDEVKEIAKGMGWKEGTPIPAAAYTEQRKRAAEAGPQAKAAGLEALLDSLGGQGGIPSHGAPAAQPATKAPTMVNPSNKKTYFLHPDGRYYLAPPTQ